MLTQASASSIYMVDTSMLGMLELSTKQQQFMAIVPNSSLRNKLKNRELYMPLYKFLDSNNLFWLIRDRLLSNLPYSGNMGGSAKVKKISFEEGTKAIRRVNEKLACLLKAVHKHDQGQSEESFFFHQCEYPFTEYVLRDGVPYDSSRRPIDETLVGNQKLPCGIIIGQSLEVVENVIWSTQSHYSPQAIIESGGFVGLFELVDELYGALGPDIPDWTISSGSRGFKFADFPTQKGQWDRLRKKYTKRPLETHDRKSIEAMSSHDLYNRLCPKELGTDGWSCKIIYFAPPFVEVLKRQKLEDQNSPASQLCQYLLESSWHSISKVREGSHAVYSALRAWGGNTNSVIHCEIAHIILSACREIISGRRPCMVPVKVDDSSGPFNVIKTSILDVAQINPIILRPAYLVKKGDVGFLSLFELAPDFFATDRKQHVEEVGDVIARARTEALKSDRKVPRLESDGLFNKLTFRVKTGQKTADKILGRQGTIETFKLKFNIQNKRVARTNEPIDINDFYAPFFQPDAANDAQDQNHPPRDSSFFRVAIRIER